MASRYRNIGAEGARHLAEALKVNKRLEFIDLYNSNIGAEGAKALAEALKVNTSLEKINLKCNKIGDEGAKELAEAYYETIEHGKYDFGNFYDQNRLFHILKKK